MKRNQVIVNLVLMLCLTEVFAEKPYGERLCHHSGYRCVTVDRFDSWAQLFPDLHQRDLVMRVNRMSVFLKPDMVIAVPEDVSNKSLFDVSPFPQDISPPREKLVQISLNDQAWVAYNEMGQQVKWGPISSGIAHCPELNGDCTTPKGQFRITRKQGKSCVSHVFPMRLDGTKGGAAMPYCMHFYQGYALHGGDDLNGLPSSHGCVNLLTVDAQWLNESFVELPGKGRQGTLVVIL